MHEPLAWGALPAQHSRWHIEPAETGTSGTTPARKAVSSTPASNIRAALTKPDRLWSDRFILEVSDGFCHARRHHARF
jgi:hypothetical protein